MIAYWTDPPGPPITATEAIERMEKLWREVEARVGDRPSYIPMAATMREPRRVYRWRGRTHVVSAHRVPTLDWLKARGVVFGGR